MVLLRVAFRPHMVFISVLRYDVPMCFGLSLEAPFEWEVCCTSDWDILWRHMKCRVAHPLRLITFNVGDAPWHSIGRFATIGS